MWRLREERPCWSSGGHPIGLGGGKQAGSEHHMRQVWHLINKLEDRRDPWNVASRLGHNLYGHDGGSASAPGRVVHDPNVRHPTLPLVPFRAWLYYSSRRMPVRATSGSSNFGERQSSNAFVGATPWHETVLLQPQVVHLARRPSSGGPTRSAAVTTRIPQKVD